MQSAQCATSVPGLRHLVLGGQEGVVDGGGGSVAEGGEAKQLDLGEAECAGIARPVQSQAHGRRHLCFHQLDLNVGQTTGDDWRGQWQHVDAIGTDLHRHGRRAG